MFTTVTVGIKGILVFIIIFLRKIILFCLFLLKKIEVQSIIQEFSSSNDVLLCYILTFFNLALVTYNNLC